MTAALVAIAVAVAVAVWMVLLYNGLVKLL